MAAFVFSARPISQILPGDFDLFPSPSSSSSTPSTSTLKPRTQGHYRPHSTLYTSSPYIEVEEKPASARLLKRSSSFGGLQSIQKMNLGLSLKPRKHVQSSSVSQFGTSSSKVSLPLRLPKTITHVTNSPPASPLPSLRKKRSMISIFSTASDVLTASPTEPSVPSPLGSRPVIIPPSIPEHPPPKSTAKSPRPNSGYDPKIPPFVPKSIWAVRSNMKLHPYQTQVPYMQAYDPILLESDRYSDLLLQRLSKGSPSFAEWDGKVPSTALDLGCGEGHWIVYASTIWKDTQFTGFDLVNITTSTFRSMENVDFVQGDFVKYRLPFPDNSFDFVRMANLLLCVPYFCWARLFAEVRRVLTDKGRIEVIDDQLFFPYSRPPVMKARRPRSFDSTSSRGADSDLDGDTLHGYGSGEDSTFNSEGTCVSSFEDDESHMSSFPTSETVRPIYRSRPSSIDSFEDPYEEYGGQFDVCRWKQKAMASRNLEETFQAMLLDYGLIPHPSQSIAGLLQHTFGNSGGKIKSFRIKLAEWSSPIGPTKKESVDVGEPKESLVENNVVGNKKKPWSTTKIDRDTKKSKKKDQVLTSVQVHSDFFILESAVPDSVKPKAAKKLGLDFNINSPTPSKPIPMEKKDKTPSPSYSPVTASEPFPIAVSSSPVRSNTTRKPPNAKTAALLGVSYSELVKATVEATTARSGPVKPRGLIQSPGLLIGEGEYLAIEPTELEMHACKYIHTLLGCRPALGLFVSQHKDQDGNPFVTETEFDNIIWEYEMFRRTRLGWPNGNEFDQIDEEPESPRDSSFYKPLLQNSQRDEPVPIRTIRVYEGRKLADAVIPFGVFGSEPPRHK